jgi:NADPH:quinone reductase-like Zn-dependent oxidoreductase
VGAGVNPNELKVGDRVYCLKKQAYSTYITTPTVFCTRIPDDLSFDEAASMLMPYVTAIHSLVNVGRLVKGQVSQQIQQYSPVIRNYAYQSVILT